MRIINSIYVFLWKIFGRYNWWWILFNREIKISRDMVGDKSNRSNSIRFIKDDERFEFNFKFKSLNEIMALIPDKKGVQRTIHLGPGTYYVEEPIVMKSYVTICGCGRNTTIILKK